TAPPRRYRRRTHRRGPSCRKTTVPRPPAACSTEPRACQLAGSNSLSSGDVINAASNSMAPSSVGRLDSGIVLAGRAAMLVIRGRILHHRDAARHHWGPMTVTLLQEPPTSICLLRLSALGDVCHALPVARTLQDTWPESRVAWVIGKVEHKLLGHIP